MNSTTTKTTYHRAVIRDARATLHWNVETVADALRIEPSEVREHFTDGRIIGGLVELRLAHELRATRIATEGGGTMLRDGEGDWRVRILTDHVALAPSAMFGTQRSFHQSDFESFISRHCGFVIADARAWPDIPYVAVPSDVVLLLVRRGHVRGGKLNRDTALRAFFHSRLF